MKLSTIVAAILDPLVSVRADESEIDVRASGACVDVRVCRPDPGWRAFFWSGTLKTVPWGTNYGLGLRVGALCVMMWTEKSKAEAEMRGEERGSRRTQKRAGSDLPN